MDVRVHMHFTDSEGLNAVSANLLPPGNVLTGGRTFATDLIHVSGSIRRVSCSKPRNRIFDAF